MNILANGSGEFDTVVANGTIGSVGQQGIVFDTGVNSNRVDFTLTDSNVTANGNNALLATVDEGTGDVRFLFQENQFTNDSAASPTVDIQLSAAATLNATIGSTITNNPGDDQAPPAAPIGNNNNFNNLAVGGDPFSIEVDNAGGTLNLDLRDNTVQGGTVQFVLTQTNGSFNLVDATDTINGDNNVGAVNATGTINTIAPPVPAPTP